jgi:hypothetical protein
MSWDHHQYKTFTLLFYVVLFLALYWWWSQDIYFTVLCCFKQKQAQTLQNEEKHHHNIEGRIGELELCNRKIEFENYELNEQILEIQTHSMKYNLIFGGIKSVFPRLSIWHVHDHYIEWTWLWCFTPFHPSFHQAYGHFGT